MLQRVYVCLAASLLANDALAQQRTTRTDSATVRVRVLRDSIPLTGARAQADSTLSVTRTAGAVVIVVPPGARTLLTQRIGFAPDTLRLILRAGQDTAVDVRLVPHAEDLEDVVISATRAERRIEAPAVLSRKWSSAWSGTPLPS